MSKRDSIAVILVGGEMKKTHADYADDADKKDATLTDYTDFTDKKTGRLMSSSTKMG